MRTDWPTILTAVSLVQMICDPEKCELMNEIIIWGNKI